MDVIEVVLTSVLSVAALFIIAKIMGHKQIAQLDFFDYISGITIGSIAGELATGQEVPWKSLISLSVYGICSVCLNLLAQKNPRTRKYINGTPTILFDKGKIFRENLKKAKLDISEFLLLCREQGYFNLDDIQTAVYEQNGKLSVLPTADSRPLTPADMNIAVTPSHIGTEIILDGRIMGDNLSRMGRDENWLEKRLAEQGFKDTTEVFLGIYHPENDSLALYTGE